MRGATSRKKGSTQHYRKISIHAPHARSDYRMALALFSISQFQSTLLMRGATSLSYLLMSAVARFQSTLLMRGATCDDGFRDVFAAISIHAPHARSDMPSTASARRPRFQSTLLMRGATTICGQRCRCNVNFNPRSSCEERPHGVRVVELRDDRISIHAPHARSDICCVRHQR